MFYRYRHTYRNPETGLILDDFINTEFAVKLNHTSDYGLYTNRHTDMLYAPVLAATLSLITPALRP